MKQPKEHLPTGAARKAQLAEQRAEEERWAAFGHRTPRHAVTLRESHDSGNMGGEGTANYGPKSAFAQITSVTGVAVVDVIR